MISGVAAGLVGATTLSGCSADPVKEAQGKADRAVPGQLQVAEAHREKFELFHGSLYATYRSIEGPDCGFTVGEQGFGAKTIQKEYTFAVWRTRELRRIQDTLARVDRTVAAVDIDPGGNYLVGVGESNITVTVWLQSPLAKTLVAECARLDRAATAWRGPDMRIPTGSDQVGKSPDRTETFRSSFLCFELLPADSRASLPAPRLPGRPWTWMLCPTRPTPWPGTFSPAGTRICPSAG